MTAGTFSGGTTWSSSQQHYWNISMPTWRDPEQPYLYGGGSPEFSSCTDLVVPKAGLIWDVNRYYRDLGIKAPYWLDRVEIRRAFREGARGARETFCFKQLMNREVREKYDAAPWGCKFMDEFEWQRMKDKALAEMLKRGMDVEDKDLIKTVFAALGVPVTDETQDILDNPAEAGDDVPEPLPAPGLYAFAYYLWKTSDHPQDQEVLAIWQPLIVRALSDLGVRMRVSLGLMGRTPHQWSIGTVGRRTVAYLNRAAEPDPAVAAKIAAALADQRNIQVTLETLRNNPTQIEGTAS